MVMRISGPPWVVDIPPNGNVLTLHNSSPNSTLNDTSGGAGVAATPFPVPYTIKGGVMQPASAIRMWGGIDWAGPANSKNIIVKVGPASGDWNSASSVYSGQSGLSTPLFSTVGLLLWGDNATNAQRGNPANTVHFMNASNASVAGQTTLDTTMDWNIWIGIQFGTLNGGNTATLRHVIIEHVPAP